MTRYSRYWTAFVTIFTKEFLRFAFRIWLQTILPPAITTTLYYITFGNLIGSRIGKMDGYSYIDFIIARLDPDGRNHQLLFQCGLFFL